MTNAAFLKSGRVWFYCLAVPLGWAGVSLLHFQFPGDEYALWAISSMAGTWVLLLLPNVGDIKQLWLPLTVAGTGALVLAGCGALLRWLRVRWWIWTILWLIASAGWLAAMLSQYPTLERAMAKNGSWWAYILSALLMGANTAMVAGLVAGAGKRWVQWWRATRDSQPS
jgi:hypothetical protein